MKRNLCLGAVLVCLAAPGIFGQLTQDQKVADFTQLAALYAKNYAPYEWKRDVIGFDLYNIKPWLDQVRATTNDLAFYDVCVRYVAALQDSHDEFTLPTDYEAWAHLGVDIYDGKVLIDGIDRFYLPSKTYTFQVGDEVVSIDGRGVQDWITALQPYAVNGSANPVSRNRLAINLAVDRLQSWWPLAVPSSASVMLVVRNQKDGTNSTFTIPWDIFGTPFTSEGPIPPLVMSAGRLRKLPMKPQRPRVLSMLGRPGMPDDNGEIQNPWGVYIGDPPDVEADPVTDPLLNEIQTMAGLDLGSGSIFPFGSFAPVFNPPTGFKLRLGGGRTDQFVSATFPVGSSNVGFIRVPTMSPSSTSLALQQFATEMAFFQQNTDGMVIDVMGNGGGSLCYVESLMTYLMPAQFRSVAYNIRATQFWVAVFSSSLESAKRTGAPQWVIDLYTSYLKAIQQAYSGIRGMTGDIPICSPNFLNVAPATDSRGNLLAYTKPILILTDNFSLSAAEAFSALMQDPGRATIFGTRTDGGGGNPGSYNATTYSEGSTRATRTFITRARPVQTPGFPATLYIENVGVYPDIIADYMTQDNVLNGGKPFVGAFSTAIANLIAKAKP
jgi:hypothetical protein